jgi:hypothetical protein
MPVWRKELGIHSRRNHFAPKSIFALQTALDALRVAVQIVAPQNGLFPELDALRSNRRLVAQVRLGLDGSNRDTAITQPLAQALIPATGRRGLHVEKDRVPTPDEFRKYFDRLPALRKLDQSRVRSIDNSGVRFAKCEHGHVKTIGIEPGHNFAAVAHLCIKQTGVRETVHENAYRPHRRVTAMPESKPSELVSDVRS